MNNCQKRGCRSLETKCKDCGRLVNEIVMPIQHEWISVKERLPEKDKEVITWPNYERFPEVKTAYYSPEFPSKWRCDEYMDRFITHWQPMPASPKEKS